MMFASPTKFSAGDDIASEAINRAFGSKFDVAGIGQPGGAAALLADGGLSVAAARAPVTARVPNAADDATCGYTTSSVWQQDGAVWQPLSVAAGQALWAPAPTIPGALPVDAIGKANVRIACGTVAMLAGYAGPALDVATVVGGSTITTTIAILASGRLDISSLYAVLAAQDAGTNGHVTRWYDQTGAGNHLVAAGSVPGPLIGRVQLAGNPALSWGENLGPAGLQIPASVSISPTAFLAALMGRVGCTNGNAGVLMELGQSSASNTVQIYTDDPGTIHVNQSNNAIVDLGLSIGSRPGVLTVDANSVTTVNANEDMSGSIALKGAALSGGYLGHSSGNAGMTSSLQLIGFVLSAPPGSAAIEGAWSKALRQGAYVRFGFTPQVRDQVVVVGDSRSQGVGTDDGRNWPMQMLAILDSVRPVQLYNTGHAGETAATMASGAAPYLASRFRPGVKNIAIVFAGINDVFQGHGPAAAFAALQSICASLKGAGYTVVLLNELNFAANQADLDALHGLIAAGPIQADIVIDPRSVPQLANLAIPTWSQDGLHPNTAASAALAAFVAQSVTPLLRQP